MEKKLRQLFDYQKFEKNADLKRQIDSVTRFRSFKISDEDLMSVAAAGANTPSTINTDFKIEDPEE